MLIEPLCTQSKQRLSWPASLKTKFFAPLWILTASTLIGDAAKTQSFIFIEAKGILGSGGGMNQ